MRFTCYRDLTGGRSLMVHRAIDRLFSICRVMDDISLPCFRLRRLLDSRCRRARRWQRILCGISVCCAFGDIGRFALYFIGLGGLRLLLLCLVKTTSIVWSYAGHDGADIGI